MSSLVLYGAGGHARVIYDIILSNNMLLEYLVDDVPSGEFFHHLEVFTPKAELLKDKKLIIAIGDGKAREKVACKIKDLCNFETLIHYSAFVSRFSDLGEGTVVMPQACVNAEVKIGKHCIINTASVIEHDCLIEDYVHISPSVTLAGNITIKKRAQIGIGTRIIQGVTVGEDAIIGAGSVIIENVPAGATVVGNLAESLK